MNKEGFKYLQARKKGILTKTDLQKRLSFAKKNEKGIFAECLGRRY